MASSDASPSSRIRSQSPAMAGRKSLARTIERCCCATAGYIPLVIVYSLTTWAVWVQWHIGFLPASVVSSVVTGPVQAILGLCLWAMLNWSYTIAVFTDPGSTIAPPKSSSSAAYNLLPTQEPRDTRGGELSLTVKSSGEIRFCKKCNMKKPDRAHHCSTCKRCVLKMDHHCPWLAACVGLRNYKPFLLFLIYTCLFCYVCFAASVSWLVSEIILQVPQFSEEVMPVNYILLSVLSGVIGLVLGGFTGWHIYLASKGQTTIESLERTRYLAPVRASMQRQIASQRNYVDQSMGDQLRVIHANALPGVLRPEEGEERSDGSPAKGSLQRNWSDMERQRERERYDEYLDERDLDKMPNAFDLGWRRNLKAVFGKQPLLWCLPVTNSEGDGFQWEASQKWIDAREKLTKDRDARIRENMAFESNRGWAERSLPVAPSGSETVRQPSPRDRMR